MDRCTACGLSLDPLPGETINFIRDRNERPLCFFCVAEAIMGTAIQQQSNNAYFRERARREEAQRALLKAEE